MQKDVQRNVNQESRIKQGEASGALNNREASSLERGQAHVDRREGRAAANGRVGAAEQRGIQRSENRQSRPRVPQEAQRRRLKPLRRKRLAQNEPAALCF